MFGKPFGQIHVARSHVAARMGELQIAESAFPAFRAGSLMVKIGCIKIVYWRFA
jgi:hypothetical protein